MHTKQEEHDKDNIFNHRILYIYAAIYILADIPSPHTEVNKYVNLI